MRFDDILKPVIILIGILSTAFGAYFFIDTTYAKASAVREVYVMVQEDRLNYRKEKLQERIWSLEDRYKKIDSMDIATKDEYRKLQKELESLEKKIDNIYKQEEN